jgi:hypothetical protein
MIENSEVIKKILTTLINISGRKTTDGHAYFIMDSLIKKLKGTYDCLKYIEVSDTRFLEDGAFISVMSDVDSMSSNEVGKAIQAIIVTMNDMMGRDAGHFFIKELSRSIGEEYYSRISDMGVDFSLMQLEHEVNEMEKRLLKTRKTD